MSFFNRQLYKQKPQAWGPVSAVQASIFKNAEKIGIDPASIALAMPLLERSGAVTIDYSKFGTHGTITNSSWVNEYIKGSDSSAQVSLGSSEQLNFTSGDFTFIFNVLGYQTDKVILSKGLSNVSGYYIQFGNGSFKLQTNQSGSNQITSSSIGLTTTSFYSLCATRAGQSVKLYSNGINVTSVSGVHANPASTAYTALLCKYPTSGAYTYTQPFYQAYCFSVKLDNAKIAYFADNPYFLLHRVAPVFYSVPGGTITITTSIDGKVIIRTTTSALLDCMASIKNNASNILDGAAVVSTTQSDAIDGKTILKSVASSVFDSKTSVLSVAAFLLDGKAIVSDTGAALFDGKGTVKDSAYDLVDGKSIIKSTNAAILDGKSIFLSADGHVIDGKIIVNAEGFSSAFLDGKTSIKSVATNYIDGLIYIGNAADKNIDGKAIIKSSVGLTIDGKTTIQDVASNLLDGSASILASIANIVDGKIIISDAVIGLLDGNASILDDSSIVLDGKVFLSSGSEINVFDGRITLSVPIVGKVTVSFSMRSPSVSFAIRTPAATVSIN